MTLGNAIGRRQMAAEEKKVKFSHELSILVPNPENVLPVPINQWRRIMKRIDECSEPTTFFVSLGWACIGAGASAAISAATFYASVEFENAAGAGVNWRALISECTVIALALSLPAVGIISLWYNNRHQKDQRNMHRILVEDMQEFSDQHLQLQAAATRRK